MRRSDGTIRLNASEAPNTQVAAVTEQTLLDRVTVGNAHVGDTECGVVRYHGGAVGCCGVEGDAPGGRIQRGEEKVDD